VCTPATEEGADDDVTLFSCSADGTAKAWALPSGDWKMTYAAHTGAVQAFAVTDEGRTLITGGVDGCVVSWDVASGEKKSSMRVHAGGITALVVPMTPSPVGEVEAADPVPPNVVLTASDDGLAKLVDMKSKAVLTLFRGEGPIASAAYEHPRVFLGGTDGKIRGFNIHTAAPTALLTGHTDCVNALLAIDGDLYSASDDSSVRLWNNSNWSPYFVFGGHSRCVSSIAVDSTQRLLSAGFDGAVRIWDREGIVNRVRAAEQRAVEEQRAKLKKIKEAEKLKDEKKAPKKR
jgi:WD40 repeat protein